MKKFIKISFKMEQTNHAKRTKSFLDDVGVWWSSIVDWWLVRGGEVLVVVPIG